MKTLSFVKRLTAVLIVLAFFIVATLSLLQVKSAAADAAPPPPVGSVRGSFNPYTDLNSVVYTTTGTAYTTARDPNYWYQADAFLTADVSGTAAVTITPQFSADGTDWADANYVYLSNALNWSNVVTATSIATSTTTLTGSVSAINTTSVASLTPYLKLSADGTDYLQFALAGRYLRYKVVAGNFVTTTDRITVTLKTVAKNTQ